MVVVVAELAVVVELLATSWVRLVRNGELALPIRWCWTALLGEDVVAALSADEEVVELATGCAVAPPASFKGDTSTAFSWLSTAGPRPPDAGTLVDTVCGLDDDGLAGRSLTRASWPASLGGATGMVGMLERRRALRGGMGTAGLLTTLASVGPGSPGAAGRRGSESGEEAACIGLGTVDCMERFLLD